MARGGYYYGMEEDSENVDMDLLAKDDHDLIDEAGEASETTDVSNISEKQEAHNEAASAGGFVVGGNEDDLIMDPVVATERLIHREFGLSVEDLEEIEEEIADTPVETEETTGTGDADLDNITTVNVVAPEGGTATVADADDAATKHAEVVPEIDSAAAVAAVEHLYRIQAQSQEDDETSSDVEFDVRTPANDVNIALEDKAVTIEPNSDGGSDTGDDFGGAEEPPAEGGEEEPAEGGEEGGEGGAEEPPAEGGEEGGNEPPAEGSESWFYI